MQTFEDKNGTISQSRTLCIFYVPTYTAPYGYMFILGLQRNVTDNTVVGIVLYHR